MAFDIPRGVIVPVDSITVRLDAAPHPFEVEHAAAIEANWQAEHAANPALFDGRMVLLAELVLRDGHLEGRAHAVRFATMLYWRKHKGAAGIEHCFAHAALISGDNALVAIRMGQQTANPGRVYFAAGSFEPDDFIDGRVDVYGNMAREVHEETGLALGHWRRDRGYFLYSENHATVLIQRFWTDEPAASIAARIEAHVAAETEPEIEGPVVIRHAEDRPDGVLPHMVAITHWHFGRR